MLKDSSSTLGTAWDRIDQLTTAMRPGWKISAAFAAALFAASLGLLGAATAVWEFPFPRQRLFGAALGMNLLGLIFVMAAGVIAISDIASSILTKFSKGIFLKFLFVLFLLIVTLGMLLLIPVGVYLGNEMFLSSMKELLDACGMHNQPVCTERINTPK